MRTPRDLSRQTYYISNTDDVSIAGKGVAMNLKSAIKLDIRKKKLEKRRRTNMKISFYTQELVQSADIGIE